MNGYQLFCKEEASNDDSLKSFSFHARNVEFGQRWRCLDKSQREGYINRAKTDCSVLDHETRKKRELKKILKKLDALKGMNIDYFFVAAVESGVEVHGSKSALQYCKRKSIPASFYAFVNSSGAIESNDNVETVTDNRMARLKQKRKSLRDILNQKYCEATGMDKAKVPYTSLLKGDFKYVVCGIPEHASLRDPSTMGEAALDLFIEKSNELTFVEREIVEGNNVLHAENVEECDKEQDNGGHIQEVVEVSGENDDNSHGELVNNVSDEYDVGHGQRTDNVNNGCDNGDVPGDREDVINNGGDDDGNSGNVFCGRDGTVNEGDGHLVTENAVPKKVDKEHRKGRSNNKRKRKEAKSSDRESVSCTKKRASHLTSYDKCKAFLCQEPSSKDNGMVDWVLCDVCQQWYHSNCVGITTKQKGKFDCGCNVSYFTHG
ncbi:uncharacterized protein LOC124455274 [Xenia sp. Carnegie-2017]|uniref:uncharacterized protein LOC124455274 n=1 Tax=Xenia sp. Carnegie-2017 TaxID=2897299 RepID=UPI001F038D5A|nr:uncharacterized protein LOC124455274 [Xenia sp. Carnegie-2017]